MFIHVYKFIEVTNAHTHTHPTHTAVAAVVRLRITHLKSAGPHDTYVSPPLPNGETRDGEAQIASAVSGEKYRESRSSGEERRARRGRLIENLRAP